VNVANILSDMSRAKGAIRTALVYRSERCSRFLQVRCDAASLGVPCTNCVAFSIDCKIPTPKRKKTSGKKESDRYAPGLDNFDASNANGHVLSERRGSYGSATENSPAAAPGAQPSRQSVSLPAGKGLPDEIGANTQAGMPSTEVPDGYASQQRTADNTYLQYMKPKFARAPIKEAGRVAYLGESSNLSLLVQDKHGATDVVHYPLPENVRGARARVNELDNVEIDILHQRGAFLLPPRALCDELVDAYFQWIAPVVPVINRSKFMRRYRDAKNPPSLLLLQAILLAGSRVCSNPQLMDANGSTTPAAMTFYKRAKALYDANYEDDRVTIVQALILLAWWWEGPEGMFRDFFSTAICGWLATRLFDVLVNPGTLLHLSLHRATAVSCHRYDCAVPCPGTEHFLIFLIVFHHFC
jgi:hypothetical protein